MKIKEKLAYMALGGVLVIAGMILGQFIFSSVNAQSPDRDEDARAGSDWHCRLT